LPGELGSAYWYVRQKELGELSNWVIRVSRATFQRQFPDLQLYPQTQSWMGSTDAYDIMDADGDYSWHYDYANLLHHYGKGAFMRALHPGKPAFMVTWMGFLHPNMHEEAVYTDAPPPQEGPWRYRAYMGTRASLALYASGIEAGMFNYVAYKPIAERGLDKGAGHCFAQKPYSPELENTVREKMMARDVKYWEGVRVQCEADLLKSEPDDPEMLNGPSKMINVGADELKKQAKEKYEKIRETAYEKTMRGSAWLNLFDTDNTRAFSNLPLPDMTPRDTLLIFPRDSSLGDGPTFPMPAVALAQGFDLAPTYDCVRLVDLNRYDTIMLLDSHEGVARELVKKINA